MPPYLLVYYVFCATTEPLAGARYSICPLPLFSEQLIPGKLTLDVHLYLSSLIHLNNGKNSNKHTWQCVWIHTDGDKLKKADKGTILKRNPSSSCVKRNYIRARKGQTESKELSNLVTSSLLAYYNLMYSDTYFSVSCLSGWCCMTLANASYSERNLNS